MAKYYDGRKAKFKETVYLKNGKKIQRVVKRDKDGYTVVIYNGCEIYVKLHGGVWFEEV